jgi:hypothetical protein
VSEFIESQPDRELWRGVHRGVSYEVSRHWRSAFSGEGRQPIFCFYLYLCVEQFPVEMEKELWRERKFTDYGTPLFDGYPLEDLDWHCGVTFYSKEGGPDGPFRGIKVGCDYDHFWDDGCVYTPSMVARDARNCIDSLWERYPTLRTMEQLWAEHRSKFPGHAEGA